MSNDIMGKVRRHPSPLDSYIHEGNEVKTDLVVDPENSLRDVEEVHCCTVVRSFHNDGYQCPRGMMTVYFCPAASSKSARCAGSMRNVDDKKLLKGGCCRVMSDGRHRRHFMET